jgi:uncharacterized protein YaiI (UPF0178 family)
MRVANRHLRTPPSALIRTVQVPSGLADNRVVELDRDDNLVKTADILWLPQCLRRVLSSLTQAEAESIEGTFRRA